MARLRREPACLAPPRRRIAATAQARGDPIASARRPARRRALAAEAHLWGGAAFDDTITVWFELTFSSDGVDLEHAQLLFNDIVGPGLYLAWAM